MRWIFEEIDLPPAAVVLIGLAMAAGVLVVLRYGLALGLALGLEG